MVNEFYELSVSSGALKEGDWTMQDPSQDSRSQDGGKLFEDIRRGAQKAPFAFLQKAESENLLTSNYHPQTIT